MSNALFDCISCSDDNNYYIVQYRRLSSEPKERERERRTERIVFARSHEKMLRRTLTHVYMYTYTHRQMYIIYTVTENRRRLCQKWRAIASERVFFSCFYFFFFLLSRESNVNVLHRIQCNFTRLITSAAVAQYILYSAVAANARVLLITYYS